MNVQADPSISIGINVDDFARIPKGRRGSVGSPQIGIPKEQLWFGFINNFFILSPNYNPFPNTRIITSPDGNVYDVAAVHIGIFTCSEYPTNNGETMHSFEVQNTGRKLQPKQCVSA